MITKGTETGGIIINEGRIVKNNLKIYFYHIFEYLTTIHCTNTIRIQIFSY